MSTWDIGALKISFESRTKVFVWKLGEIWSTYFLISITKFLYLLLIGYWYMGFLNRGILIYLKLDSWIKSCAWRMTAIFSRLNFIFKPTFIFVGGQIWKLKPCWLEWDCAIHSEFRSKVYGQKLIELCREVYLHLLADVLPALETKTCYHMDSKDYNIHLNSSVCTVTWLLYCIIIRTTHRSLSTHINISTFNVRQM